MPKQLRVKTEVSAAELAERYRTADDLVERSRLQAVWLIAQGRPTAEVATITGYSTRTVREMVHRFEAEGFAGLRDRRHEGPGHPPLLDDEGVAALRVALEAAPEDGGIWSGPKVTRWIEARIGRTVSPDAGWRWLKTLGYRLRKPRPRHARADPEEQTTQVQGDVHREDGGDRS